MKKLFLLFLAFACGSVFAFDPGDPAYASVQRSVGGIVQSTAVARGASLSDPRTYATLYGMGKAAVASTAVGAVGTGLLVTAGAATAPAWGTILAVAAVSGAVSYAISLGLDQIQRWMFAPEGVRQANMFTQTFQCQSAPGSNGADCQCQAPKTGTTTLLNPATYGDRMYSSTCSCVVDDGGACVASGVPTTPVVPLATAANSATSAQLAQPVDYQSMALMINDLWKKAAAQPDYQGLPYVLAQPVTATEVQTWAQANPSVYPKVADLLSPVADPSVGLVPSSTSAPGTSVSPVVTPTNPYAPPQQGASSPTSVTLDLGPNPGTPSPSLDAPDWFQPLLNMLPGWRSASFTAQGQCMKPSFDFRPFMQSVIEMHSHCDLFEQHRALLSSVMAVVWVMVAAFIVLEA